MQVNANAGLNPPTSTASRRPARRRVTVVGDDHYHPLIAPPPSLPVRGGLVVLVMDSESQGMARQIDSPCRPPRTSAENDTGATDNYLAPTYQRFIGRAGSGAEKRNRRGALGR